MITYQAFQIGSHEQCNRMFAVIESEKSVRVKRDQEDENSSSLSFVMLSSVNVVRASVLDDRGSE